MEGILFCEDRLLNGRYFILGKIGCSMEGIYFGKIGCLGRYFILLGCLMEGILFWEDRLLNGRYFILERYAA